MLPPLHRLAVAPTGRILDDPHLPQELLQEIEDQLLASGTSRETCRNVRNWLVQQGRAPSRGNDLPETAYRQLCRRLGWVWSATALLPGFTWTEWFKQMCYYTSELRRSPPRTNVIAWRAALFANAGRMISYQGFGGDRDYVLRAVGQDDRALKFASEALKNDKEVVLAAVTKDGGALKWASAALQNDREVVLATVTQYGYALQFAPIAFRNDKEVVLAAVTQNGYALESASEALQNDKEVVLAAVTQNGYALESASEALRNDKEVALAAVTQNGYALRFAPIAFRNDKAVVLVAVTQDEDALRFASDELKNDNEVRAAAGLRAVVAMSDVTV